MSNNTKKINYYYSLKDRILQDRCTFKVWHARLLQCAILTTLGLVGRTDHVSPYVPEVRAGRTDHVDLGLEHGLKEDRVWLVVLCTCLIQGVA